MISRPIANRSLTLHAHAMFVKDITICCRPEIECQNLVMNINFVNHILASKVKFVTQYHLTLRMNVNELRDYTSTLLFAL